MEIQRRRPLSDRMIGAAPLRTDVDEAVEADRAATEPAALVAVASAAGRALLTAVFGFIPYGIPSGIVRWLLPPV
ncbi:MAG TPA: hypothetical protein VF212_05085 [Longimicrobiales bacterium]